MYESSFASSRRPVFAVRVSCQTRRFALVCFEFRDHVSSGYIRMFVSCTVLLCLLCVLELRNIARPIAVRWCVCVLSLRVWPDQFLCGSVSGVLCLRVWQGNLLCCTQLCAGRFISKPSSSGTLMITAQNRGLSCHAVLPLDP